MTGEPAPIALRIIERQSPHAQESDITIEHRFDRDDQPQRTPLEELLNAALITAEVAEARLPHVVIAEIGPQHEQMFIGPGCSP